MISYKYKYNTIWQNEKLRMYIWSVTNIFYSIIKWKSQ